jgi:hypothetical protein
MGKEDILNIKVPTIEFPNVPYIDLVMRSICYSESHKIREFGLIRYLWWHIKWTFKCLNIFNKRR